MVIVAADGPTPTALGPVYAGSVNGTAVDHGAGHPGQDSQEHELDPHSQGLVFFLHTP